MTFRNSVVGGDTLVRAAIQSPNFVTGVSGWTIKRDGSAEFNNVTIRGGTVISGTSLYYNGAPAAGNLVGSISATSGTDSFGNAYLAGVVTYDTSGTGLYVQMQTDGDLALGYTSVFQNAGVVSAVFNGLQIVTPYTNSAPNNDPLTLSLQPGGVTGADRGFMSLATGNGLDISANIAGRLNVTTQETSTQAIVVDAVTGTTADLLDLQVNADSKFTVDENGDLTTYSNNTFTSYTPSLNNAGTATFSTADGWYQRIGKMIFFSAYLVASAAGSGGSNVTLNAPTSIDRTTRWTVLTNCEGNTAGNNGSCTSLAFTSGSGTAFDRLRNSTGTNIIGTDITASTIITASGWYREA